MDSAGAGRGWVLAVVVALLVLGLIEKPLLRRAPRLEPLLIRLTVVLVVLVIVAAVAVVRLRSL